MTRFVILHYHLFKNAGTSLDAAFKAAFGGRWANTEAPDGAQFTCAQVSEWLTSHPDVTVLSSHTAMLPPPQLPDTDILPVIFVREPLDRVRSVYDFERRQQADTLAARRAKELSLRGYVEWRLHTKGDRAIRNFHTYRLAAAVPGPAASEAERAHQALAQLPFVGVVEAYDRSLARLEPLIRERIGDVTLARQHRNATQRPDSTLAERVGQLRDDLGDELFDELYAGNEADIALHRAALERLGC